MARARKLFIPEVNYAMPDHLPNMLLDVPNLDVWTDPKTGRLGVWKKPGTSEQYRFAVSNALYHQMIRIDEECFTCTSDKDGQTMRVDKMLAKLQNQLERYRYVRQEPNNDFGKTKVKLSGKSGGENDDLVMVFMMGVTWGTVYLMNPAMSGHTGHGRTGGQFAEVSARQALSSGSANADVARARDEARKLAEHEEKFSQRVTTRASMGYGERRLAPAAAPRAIFA